jgi:hypothetical protein
MNENATVGIIPGSAKPYSDEVVPFAELDGENFSQGLLAQINILEAEIGHMSADAQRERGCQYYSCFLRHARKAIVYGTYFGVVLRAQFKGTTDRKKKQLCKTYNISLSSARRYVSLVENLRLILGEIEKQHLAAEEMGLKQLLAFIPKKEGQGGRPTNKAPAKVLPAKAVEADTDGEYEVPDLEVEDPETVDEEPDDEWELEDETPPQSPDDEAEIEFTVVVTGTISAATAVIGDVVSSLGSGAAEILAAKPLKIVRDKETIGKFTITHIVVKE